MAIWRRRIWKRWNGEESRITMKPIWKFRLFVVLILLLVGGVSISNLVSEFLRPVALPLPSRTSTAPASDQVSSARWVSAIAPVRSDLKADYALALAGQRLKSEYTGQSQDDLTAQNAVKNSLKFTPLDSRMWLVLALLQARSNLGDPRINQTLTMSYLTGPNRAELIATRLDIATSNNALSDPDLRDLAGGDVRAILVHYPDSRQTLVNDYARGSTTGKAFLEESARTIDPNFVNSLRSAK
jgi:hypothetical protein